jgi:Fe-S cluster assembly protein SufD
MERGARATVIERHHGCGHTPAFHNSLTEVLLDQSAEFEHYRLIDTVPSEFHLDNLFVRQMADSVYHHCAYAINGGWTRSEFEIDFAAPGARATLDGLFIADDEQTADFHLNIQHHAPRCQSETNFKGIAQGRGRGVFDGRILVARDAQQTEAHLTNNNLLLDRRAEIDTKPQLEIFADDVQCSHGTTVGELDEDQLFYLRSRGLDAGEAWRMLCKGFATDVIDSCDNASLREQLLRLLDEKLQPSAASEQVK